MSDRPNESEPSQPATNSRRAIVALIAAAGVLAVLWALDPLVIHTNVLTPFYRQMPAAPLYSFWAPVARWQAVGFALLCAGAVWLMPILLRKATPRRFGLTLALAALLLPPALFAARQPIRELGAQLQIYEREEYLWDARRITDLPGFLRQYAQLVPQLSSHGRTHPPGNAALLYLIGKPIGFSPLAVGIGILALFAAGIIVTYLWMREVCGETGARVGALLTLASPSVLNFACTAMDAVFLLVAALAVWPGIVAFSPRGKIRHAVAAGGALFLAMMFSFSAFPVGLLIAVYGGVILFRKKGIALRRLGIILISFLASYLLVDFLTGFDLWEDFAAARGEHVKQMTWLIGRPLRELYGKLVYGNISAFLIGCGVAIVALFGLRIVALMRGVAGLTAKNAKGAKNNGDSVTAEQNLGKKLSFDPFLIATLVTGAVLCAGGLFTMEIERIWLFAIPWFAAVAVGTESRIAVNETRWLCGAGWAQALGMAALLFTLW